MRSKIAAGALVLSVLLAPASFGAGAPVVPGMTATYDFFFGGLRAGEMTVSADFGAEAYRAGAEFRTTGIAGLLSDTEMTVSTEGRVGAAGLTPVRFTSNERENRDVRVVEVDFSGGGPSSVSAEPAFKTKPWSIDARDQQGAIDPLSAILHALAPATAEKACNRRVEAFDGEHRFAFEFGPPQRSGDGLTCEGAYIRVAGFKPSKMSDMPMLPLHLRLEERPDGLYQLVSLRSELKYGVVVMQLRDRD